MMHSDVQALLWWLAALIRVTKEHWMSALNTGAAESSICISKRTWGTAAGLALLCLFLLLLDRQDSLTLRKPVTSWTNIRTGGNQILRRLPCKGSLQWGPRWTWHEGGRAWSTCCCLWLGSSNMWRYHYVDPHIFKENWLHLRDLSKPFIATLSSAVKAMLLNVESLFIWVSLNRVEAA